MSAQVEYVQQLINDYNHYFDIFNQVLIENNAQILHNFNLTLKQLDLVKQLITQAHTDSQELLAFKDSVRMLLDKLNTMEQTKQELLEANTKALAFIEQLKTLVPDALQSIKEKTLQSINQLHSVQADIKTDLLALQAQINTELDAHKDAIAAFLQTQAKLVETQVEEFKKAYALSKTQMNAYLAAMLKVRDFVQALEQSTLNECDRLLKEFDANALLKTQEYNDNAAKLIQDYDTNAQTKLDAYNLNATQLLAEYNDNDRLKTQAFNDNTLAKINLYNTNATQQLDIYNANDRQKLDEYNDNARAKLEDYKNVVTLRVDEARKQVEAFNTANLTKLAEFERRVNQAIKEYDDNALAKIQDFDNHETQKTQEMDRFVISKLEEHNLNAQQKLDDYNANHITKVGLYDALTTKKSDEASKALSTLKETLIQQVLVGTTAERAEIAGLKTLLEQLQAKQTRFGADFKTIIYTQNDTFYTPTTGIYYYVFVQGGSGVDNSPQNGAPSSFGQFVSVQGGRGGQTGLGQPGSCRAGWFELTDAQIPVIVGAGGCCVVSWAQRIN
ncbi:coiled-coil domain-containing protein [Helicobacter cynogastricus]|uniref:hypothetical protein n=1 Tax=Helicobacter cynogastricus TaxID=329937 RepID=UPI000CF18BCC|nr:hypothetical protein [Helicobacter cynogastricus]